MQITGHVVIPNTHKFSFTKKKNCFVFIVFIDVKTVWCQRSALLKWVCRCTGFVKKITKFMK